MRNKIFGTGLVFLPVALVVIIADYLSKLYIINHLAPYDPQAWIEVIPGVVGLLYACLLFTTLYIRCRIKWTLPAGAGCLLIATLLMRADLFLPSAA